jgi:hypothetical protein
MFGLGEFIGNVLAAPIRILDIPNKVIDKLIGDEGEKTIADKVADTIVEQAKKIAGDK